MPVPATLGLRPGWIYEVAATTLGGSGPHAAPLGVSTPDGNVLRVELYKGSTTLANVLENGALGINFLSEAAKLQTTLHHRDKLRFVSLTSGVDEAAPAAPLFLEDADAWLALCRPQTEDAGRLVRVTAVPGHFRVFRPVRLINRAEGLLLESLVLSTRLYLMPPDEGRERLLENARVIAKVAPDSTQAAAIADLLAVLDFA